MLSTPASSLRVAPPFFLILSQPDTTISQPQKCVCARVRVRSCVCWSCLGLSLNSANNSGQSCVLRDLISIRNMLSRPILSCSFLTILLYFMLLLKRAYLQLDIVMSLMPVFSFSAFCAPTLRDPHTHTHIRTQMQTQFKSQQ